MDTELVIKFVTAAVVVSGAVLGFLQLLSTKRTHVYQNSKTEMELLSQCIADQEADSDYKSFLTDVRKEKMSFLVFGVSIPNADLERVIAFYRKAEGRVTIADIAEAWPYRGPSTKPLSFHLSIVSRIRYWVALTYVGFCAVAFLFSLVFVLTFKQYAIGPISAVCVFLVSALITTWIHLDLFTAVGLAKLEERMLKDHYKLPPLPSGSSKE